ACSTTPRTAPDRSLRLALRLPRPSSRTPVPEPMPASPLVTLAAKLRDAVDRLAFTPPEDCTYNPLRHTCPPHRPYLERYRAAPNRTVFLRMNPGPFGMAQTGVPFGEVAAVRDWIGINEPVDIPFPEHPKRPVTGFACTRSEVSGRRLWGLFAQK